MMAMPSCRVWPGTGRLESLERVRRFALVVEHGEDFRIARCKATQRPATAASCVSCIDWDTASTKLLRNQLAMTHIHEASSCMCAIGTCLSRPEFTWQYRVVVWRDRAPSHSLDCHRTRRMADNVRLSDLQDEPSNLRSARPTTAHRHDIELAAIAGQATR